MRRVSDGTIQGKALDCFTFCINEGTGYRMQRRESIGDSQRVERKTKQKGKGTQVADSGSKSTSSKHGDSVASAVFAAAVVGAVAYEAFTESRQKEHSEHAEVKLDDRNKVAHDRDHLVTTETSRIIKDDQASTVEKDVAVNRTVQRTVVVDSPASSEATTTVVALDQAPTKIQQSGCVKSEIA